MFETFSFLPPLTDAQIAKQVDYIINNGWTPCLEFAEASNAYVSQGNTVRMGPVAAVSLAGHPATRLPHPPHPLLCSHLAPPP